MIVINSRTLVDSIVKILSSDEYISSKCTIYDGYTEQNLSTPCIIVTEHGVRSKEQLHNITLKTTIFELEILCSDRTDKNATSEDKDIYNFTRSIIDRIEELLYPLIDLYVLNNDKTDMIKSGYKSRTFNFNGHPYEGRYYIYLTCKERVIIDEELEKWMTLENKTVIKED